MSGSPFDISLGLQSPVINEGKFVPENEVMRLAFDIGLLVLDDRLMHFYWGVIDESRRLTLATIGTIMVVSSIFRNYDTRGSFKPKAADQKLINPAQLEWFSFTPGEFPTIFTQNDYDEKNSEVEDKYHEAFAKMKSMMPFLSDKMIEGIIVKQMFGAALASGLA